MSAYAGRTFEEIIKEEIAELSALGITVNKILKSFEIYYFLIVDIVSHKLFLMQVNYYYI